MSEDKKQPEQRQPNRLAECLTEERLRDFSAGLLPEGEIQSIAAHLDHCLQCSRHLETIQDASDTFIESLRAAKLPAWSPDDDRRVRSIVARLSKVGLLAISRAEKSPPSESPPPRVKTIGNYRLIKVLGRGGMGDVYQAVHERLNQTVAIKLMNRRRIGHDRHGKRFRREMLAIGGLNHANVVRALDAGEADGQPYIVMECVEGVSASDISKTLGPLAIADACEIIRQAALGLDHIHQHGRIHRDIKPSNLLVSTEGNVKIVDLGLARMQTDDEDSLTEHHDIFGTLDYMAPEQARDARTVDIRADIYSLGCTLFKLLTGAAPYVRHQTAHTKVLAHESEPIPELTALREEIPQELRNLLDGMLAKTPVDRISEPAEVAKALTTLSSGANLSACVEQTQSSLDTAVDNFDDTFAGESTDWSALRARVRPKQSLVRRAIHKLRTSRKAQFALLVAIVIPITAFAIMRASRPEGSPSSSIPPRQSTSGITPIIWKPPPGEQPWRIDRQRDALVIDKTEGVALKLGELRTGRMQMHIRFRGLQAGGMCGIIIGHKIFNRVGTQDCYYQQIQIRTSQESDRATLLHRATHTNRDPVSRSLQGSGSETLASHPMMLDWNLAHTMTITIQNLHLKSIAIDGVIIVEHMDLRRHEALLVDSNGDFGVYAGGMSILFDELLIDGVKTSLSKL